MKEKGLILPLKDCDIMILPYWKCLSGHLWEEHDHPHLHRICTRCNKHMIYALVNCGMNKAWVWTNLPGKAPR